LQKKLKWQTKKEVIKIRIFELFGEVALHDNGVEGQLSNIDKRASGVGKVFGGLGKVALVAGAAIVAGIGAGAAIGYKLAESASNLSEAQNVVETTFKKSGKAIEAWAKTTAKTAGISETASTQYVGFMGAMLKSSGLSEKASEGMSKSLVQLTGDMSSFYNVDTKDMWEKLRSGISGETEPLKALGINMSVANLEAYALADGIKKPYKEMTQGEQTQLRYNFLMNATKDAQGDFGKTLSTSFANQVRVAQLNIETLGQKLGTKLLPAFNSMFKWVNDNMPLIESIANRVFNVIGVVITNVGNIVNTVLIPRLKAIWAWIQPYMPQIQNTVKVAFDMIKNVMKTASDFIVNNVLPVYRSMASWFVTNFPAIKNAVMQAYNYIKPSFDNLVAVVKSDLIPIITGLWNTVKLAIPGIKAIFQIVFPILVAAVKIAIDGIAAFIVVVKAIYNMIKPGLDNVAQIFSTVFKGIRTIIDVVQNALDWFNRTPMTSKSANVNTNYTSSGDKSGTTWDTSKLKKKAKGDNNWQGGPVITQEAGGEILDLPSGTRIIPHDVSMEMARNSGKNNSGGGINLTITNFINDRKQSIEELAEELQYYIKKKNLGGAN